jgi:hypothetical protein
LGCQERLVNVQEQPDGRWVLGNPVGQRSKCKAPNAVKYVANGRAEVWHAPTDRCDWARKREREFDAAAREDEHRAREHAERAAEARARRYAA